MDTTASRDWSNTSHGRKIEAALEKQGQGYSLKIITEEDWIHCLGERI